MQGNEALIKALNSILADEFAAIHQYGAHLAMVGNWQYTRLAAYIAEHLEDERKHAAALMDRIAFLGGVIDAPALGRVVVGADVPAQLAADGGGELRAIQSYERAIVLAVQVGDNKTRDLLAANLADENDHLQDVEARQRQAAAMTLANFLSAQI